MGIQITSEQVTAMTPDKASLSNGKKLSGRKHWKTLGQNDDALWGECQGSALYQVKVEVASLVASCSCPSRKLPCKHALGLLLLAANTPDELTTGEPPEWVSSWLEKRAESTQRKETKSKESKAPSAKSVAKRQQMVEQGLERLDLWLSDLVRNGLGSIEAQPASYWDTMAKQMVDNQIPGIAARVRRMGESVHATTNWTQQVFVQSGQLALLSQAYRRLDTLPQPLQDDVRAQIGWTLTEDEVIQRGEHVHDTWLFLGNSIEETDKGKTQRTWLYGEQSQRAALLTQFIPRIAQSFPNVYPFGMRQQAELAFWPGAASLRALIVEQQGALQPLGDSLPGTPMLDAFLASVATILARQPWQDTFLGMLCGVTPILTNHNQWAIYDHDRQALPLSRGEYWRLLALSGGEPVDLAAIWDGETLQPIGTLVAGHYYKL